MAATEHENHLTICNRRLVADLEEARRFLRDLIDPEALGHAVSTEVRTRAAQLLIPRPLEQTCTPR